MKNVLSLTFVLLCLVHSSYAENVRIVPEDIYFSPQQLTQNVELKNSADVTMTVVFDVGNYIQKLDGRTAKTKAFSYALKPYVKSINKVVLSPYEKKKMVLSLVSDVKKIEGDLHSHLSVQTYKGLHEKRSYLKVLYPMVYHGVERTGQVNVESMRLVKTGQAILHLKKSGNTHEEAWLKIVSKPNPSKVYLRMMHKMYREQPELHRRVQLNFQPQVGEEVIVEMWGSREEKELISRHSLRLLAE